MDDGTVFTVVEAEFDADGTRVIKEVRLLSEFPFTKPATSDADMFIQWKGTDLCMDFHCPCGAHCHVDASFAYYVRCGACGQVYQMGTQVIVRRVDQVSELDSVVDMPHDDEYWSDDE